MSAGNFPAFPGAPPTSRTTAVTILANGFYGQVWTIWEHICTHMDVPAHFGFGKEAVDWLLDRRRIRGIGVDTMSLDRGSSTTFDVHLTVLGADRYGVEDLRNLKRIPPRGATLVLSLIPWRAGSGGPCRAFASV